MTGRLVDSSSYRGSGTSPTLTMNWFLSVGNTVTVTRIAFLCWSKAVRKFSKTVASCEMRKNACSLPSGLRAVIQSR